MQPRGSDRSRAIGGKVILHSRISKGWTPRTPKTLTHSEHPGTTVLWDEEYFEVVSADGMQGGGVRYVLEPWREEHTIRTFEHYDDATEARLNADYERTRKQRRRSVLTRLSGVLLGNLPSPVQNHLGNEMGSSPMGMTLLSCIPPLVLVGICAFLQAGAKIAQTPSPVPIWLSFLSVLLAAESGLRFFVAMSQNRPMGSLLGTIAYVLFRALAGSGRSDLPKPFEEQGDGVFFMVPPPDDVALRDSITMRAPMLTLLPAGEQARVARHFGYNYRESAFGLAWIILIFALIGVVTSWIKVQDGRGSTAVISLLVAATLAIEQLYRLVALRQGPKGSMLGVFVRPFVRDLLAKR
jgi:hypothetical protein